MDRIAQSTVRDVLRAVVADVADTVGRATPSMLIAAVPCPRRVDVCCHRIPAV